MTMAELAYKVDNDTSVRCPEETCYGHLRQGRFDSAPRCDICLKTFALVPEGGGEVEGSMEELREKLKDAEEKLDEIRMIV